MSLKEALDYKALELARLAVQMTGEAASGHPSTALSLAHVATVLMYRVMRWNPQDPWDLRADRLVLSEGHAVPIVYAACIDLGAVVGRDRQSARPLVPEDVHGLRQAASVLDGHPNPAVGFPFFDAATGSLGQGLSAALGLALAAKSLGTRRRVFVICGDGEMREGQIAEALDFARDYNPANLVLLVNCNGLGQSDYVSPQQSAEVLARKLKAAGWAVRTVDGHNVDELEPALGRIPKARPLAVICHTVKGWGVKALQSVEAHGKALSPQETQVALDELKLPQRPAELARLRGGSGGQAELIPPRPRGKKVTAATGARRAAEIVSPPAPDFSRAAKDGRLSTRRAYGLGLCELGRANPAVVVLDGDVRHSTFADYFAEAFPERFFECRIAEQNMVSVAGGLAAGGLVPFANTFGKFFVRAYDQVEMAAIGGLNLKLAGSHSGVTLAADGPSQMALVDVAFFRALCHAQLCEGPPASAGAGASALASATADKPAGRPACAEASGFAKATPDKPAGKPMAVMLLPADAVCAYRCAELAARHWGLVYIRTLRPDVPILYRPDEEFHIGGAKVLRQARRGAERSGGLTLVGSCYTVHLALAAAEALAGENISCGVVDCYSLPVADEALLALVRDPAQKILALDDSYVGAVGSELAELAAAAQGARVVGMWVKETPKSARKPDEVLKQVGLGLEAVLAAARELARG